MGKEEIYKLIELFGLSVDYDQWDVAGKEWVRVKSNDWPNEFGHRNQCLILYKDDGKETITDELRLSLINLGKNLQNVALKKLLNI